MPHCAACGTVYPKGERFCSQDGTPLLEAPPEAPPASDPDLVDQVEGEGSVTEYTPGDLRRGVPLLPEMKVGGRLWRRIDGIKVGDPASEKAHGFSFHKLTGQHNRVHLDSFFPTGRGLS